MGYITSTSRQINTNPKTPAQLRATLSKLMQDLNKDEISLEDLEAAAELFLLAGLRPAIADADIQVGRAIYTPSEGHIDLADATSTATADVDGVAAEGIVSGSVGFYTAAGVVKDDSFSLTPNGVYFLGTAGQITLTPDETDGNVAIIIGRALSATELLVQTQQAIWL